VGEYWRVVLSEKKIVMDKRLGTSHTIPIKLLLHTTIPEQKPPPALFCHPSFKYTHVLPSHSTRSTPDCAAVSLAQLYAQDGYIDL